MRRRQEVTTAERAHSSRKHQLRLSFASVIMLGTQQAPALGKRKHEETKTDLTLDEVRKAVPALQKMLRRWRDGKRQCERRVSGDLSLSYAQIVLLANRYRAARNANREVDYRGASNNMNFARFRGQPDKLKAKEPEVIALMRRALDEQSEIGDDEHNLTGKEWSERLAKTMEKHKVEIEKLRMKLRKERRKKLTTDTKDIAAIRMKLDGRAAELEQKEKEQAAEYQALSRELAEKAAELDKQARELQQHSDVVKQQAQVLKEERENLEQQLNRQIEGEENAQRVVATEQKQQSRLGRLRPASHAAASRSARSTRLSAPNSQDIGDNDGSAIQPEFSRKLEPTEAEIVPEVIVIDSDSSSPVEDEDASSNSCSADNEEGFGSDDSDDDSEDSNEESKALVSRPVHVAQRHSAVHSFEPPHSNFSTDSTSPSAALPRGNARSVCEIDSEETETE